MKIPPPIAHPTSVVINGKTYTGTYIVESKMVTVTTGASSKTAQVGAGSVVFLARKMLGELVREGKA